MNFPLTFKESLSEWWNIKPLADSERQILSFLPFFPNPDATRTAESRMVEISTGVSLNEFMVTNTETEVRNDLVILHGYGAGLGFFYRNFDGLSVRGWRLHALDLLGYGRSSRPKFQIKAKDKYEAVLKSEGWFVDALEKWRIKSGIEKFTLMAHSLGGYLSVAYALKYPDRIKKLILVSPAGVPRDPWVVHEDLSHPPESTVGAEISQTQEEATQAWPFPRATKELKRPMPKWLVYLWENNVSPFTIVRMSGPMSAQLVTLWTNHRFQMLPGPEAKALHDYCFGLFTSKGSGEYAATRILAPGAFARIALIDRLQYLNVPTVWMYGENDWMDIKAGRNAAGILRERGIDSKCIVISRAGHHLYLDNPEDFNKAVLQELPV
ncbi:Alpha/Beta hydrolase protein [Dipodascopsis uninucleata]